MYPRSLAFPLPLPRHSVQSLACSLAPRPPTPKKNAHSLVHPLAPLIKRKVRSLTRLPLPPRSKPCLTVRSLVRSLASLHPAQRKTPRSLFRSLDFPTPPTIPGDPSARSLPTPIIPCLGALYACSLAHPLEPPPQSSYSLGVLSVVPLLVLALRRSFVCTSGVLCSALVCLACLLAMLW